MTQVLERTRTLIGKELGLELGERLGDAYRETSGAPLEGEWLGAFAQPSVVLNKVTPVSLRIDGASGASIDEYGEASLAIARHDRDRVELTKRYTGGAASEFTYVGRLVDGSLAGYWYSPLRPSFGGVFWLTRAERLEPATADRLRARVRRTSPRRRLLRWLFLAAVTASALGARLYPPLAIAALGVFVVFMALMKQRTEALRREVELWKRELP